MTAPTDPPITVVLTTYNRSALLKEALDSVLAQTFRHFTVVVDDNGSTDDTPEIIRDYQRRDPRIYHRRQVQNIGINANLREAMFAAHTPYVAWLMDDDLWLPDHLCTGITEMDKRPNAAIYGCATEMFGQTSPFIFRPAFAEHVSVVTDFDFSSDFSPLLFGTPFVASSLIVRRQALDAVRIWPKGGATIDWLLEAQATLAGSMVFNPEVLARYRWHSGNASHRMLTGPALHRAELSWVRSTLARTAFEHGSLDAVNLQNYLLSLQDLHTFRALAVCLAGIPTPSVIRRAALEALHARSEVMHIRDVFRSLLVLGALSKGGFFLCLGAGSRLLARFALG